MSKQSKNTALRLKRNINEILNIWEQRANKEIEAAHHESKLALRNSLPEFLLQLVEILANATDLTTARNDKKESTHVGKKHGKDRATSVDYTMDQMILEYHILRQVICDVLEKEAILSPVELELIIGSIEHAVNGAATEFSNTLNDLQDQSKKQKESFARELATEQRKLELIVTESPVGIALMRGPTFVFEKVNPKWTELVSDREYIGKTFIEVYPELVNTHVPQDLKMAFETGQPAVANELKIRMEVQAGVFDERYYDYIFTRISDSEGNPFGIYAHGKNVTERILIRKRLEESINDLGEERDLREKFVAALSHDLRTPLTAAKMSAQILARNMPDPLQLLKISGRIVDNMDRADSMIRDLLDAGRIKAGENLPLNIMKCDLNETIKKTTEELASVHGDRFFIRVKGPIYGFWDGTAIRRMIENLANNAVKYGGETTPVTVSLDKKDETVEISVHNEGKYIQSEDLKNIFEPYQRSASAIKGTQKGWGIGLTLVRGLAEAHGGKVNVRSSASEGTTFTVCIPLDSRNQIMFQLNRYGGEKGEQLNKQ